MNPDDIWIVKSRVRFRRVLDEAVVIHQDIAEALVVNEVGIRFLELCDGERSTGDIIALMMNEYDVSESELQNDLPAYISDLESSGIIHRSQGR